MSYTGVMVKKESDVAWTDTLEEWGLILTENLTIGEAKLKETWIDIPGANGALNLSYAMTDGEPVYEMRDISFTLFCSGLGRSGGALTHGTPPDEQAVNLIRTQLQRLYHGREVELILPDDSTRFFKGVLSVGAKERYNSGMIPITMKAYPYRLSVTETVVELIKGVASSQVTIQNDTPTKIVPKIKQEFNNTSHMVTVLKFEPLPTKTWAFTNASGTQDGVIMDGLYFGPGTTKLRINSDYSGDKLIFTYREGRL